MRLEWRLDLNNEVIERIKRFLKSNREYIKAYSERLPEIHCVKELPSKGIIDRDVIMYIIFVSVNDWNLVGLRGGAITLWNISKEEFVKGFQSFGKVSH